LPNKQATELNVYPGTHWQQSWIQHGRLCWTGNKSATKLNVQLCSTLLPIRSTLLLIRSTLPVCTGAKQHGRFCRLSTKSTVLNSTLLLVCTGLYPLVFLLPQCFN